MKDIVFTRADLPPEAAVRARDTVLHVAVALGDDSDVAVLVGGLVPTLLIAPESLPEAVEPHPGTLDVDLALAYAVLEDERYDGIERKLRQARFASVVNEAGNPERWRWEHDSDGGVVIEFLMDAGRIRKSEGQLQQLTEGLAASAFRGMGLAFREPVPVEVRGRTLAGDEESRTVLVCNPAAFVALKANALRGRYKDKDAFDLVYVIQHYALPDGRRGPEAVVTFWPSLRGEAVEALGHLEAVFATVRSRGPRSVARFLGHDENGEIATAAFDLVQQFVARVRAAAGRRT